MEIKVYNDWDHVNKAYHKGDKQVVLAWDGEYRKGDIIEFGGLKKGCFYKIKVDAAIEESLILTQEENIIYTVPFYEKKTSYNPLAFFGNRHYISVREAYDHEVKAYKNLALNPFDQHDVIGVYPHASANVETRGEAVFAARNAIDGCIATRSHGEWPYESWGINRQDDACFMLDFGRPVDIDKIDIYTRADFPHDNYWIRGKLEFSDGSIEQLEFTKHVDEPHVFKMKKSGIRWLKFYDLIKSEEQSPFPALTQIEVYGREHA
ncbi:MAG: carbohydrate-binding protein [Lachnospiraceae bacterium]|nr:carbohydrate-binding protein [Lachnospiraceae bacterium]